MIIEIILKHEAKSTKTLSRRRTSEDSSNETILDEKSLRKNTEDDKSLCKEIMEEAILEVEYQNKDP